MATLQELLMGKMMDAVTEGAKTGGKAIGDLQAEKLKGQNVLEQISTKSKADLDEHKQRLNNTLQTAAKMYGVNTEDPGWEAQVPRVIQSKGNSFAFNENGLNIGKDPTVASASIARDESNRQRLIKNIQDTYNKIVGKSPEAARAARNVLAALDAGDITTVGRLKAQLPQLEGENYRPTDAERKAMLNETGEGAFANLKNWIGGDNAALSKAQIDKFRALANKRLEDETTQVTRGRKEALARWVSGARALSPEQMADVAGTLGMSQEELMQELQGHQQTQNEDPARKRLEELRKKAGKKNGSN